MTSERGNLPSASGLERISLCTGSWLMERDLPELPELEWTASGTRIHAALAGYDVELSNDEKETFGMCENLRTDAKISAEIGPDWVEDFNPERLWDSNYSGKPDYIATSPSGKSALIVDFKTGRLETEEAPSNWQLRGYAVLWYLINDVETVTVAIIAPWQKQRLTLAKYTEKDLSDSFIEIRELIQKALTPGQPLTPGEKQCRYCRALSVCHEALGAGLSNPMNELATPLEISGQKALSRTEAANRAAVLPGIALASALDCIPLANLVIEALRAEAKSRLAEGLEVRNGDVEWRLKPGNKPEKITDLSGVWNRLKPLGVDEWDFVKQCSLSKENLADLLRKATGEKGKALSARMEQVVEGCVTITTNEPSLERVKE